MRITRRLEFDAGHRIAAHDSQCRHLHGHRYAIEITLAGDLIETPGAPNQAMVMDFSEVKAIAQRVVVEPWDHAFIACRDDKVVVEMLERLPDHKTVLLDRPPTAEVLALVAFRALDAAFTDRYGNGLRLEQVRIYETPNCWADAVRA